jgi:hypothetical protein
MTNGQTLIARTALGCALAACTFLALRQKRMWSTSSESFDRTAPLIFASSRLLLWLLLFEILRLPVRGDAMKYYLPEALSWLGGKLPYRDFSTSYAPLHPFLDSLLVRLWHSEVVLVLFSIFVESAMFWLAIPFLRRFFVDTTVRTAAILYLGSAVSVQFVTVDGQNNVEICLLILLALLAMSRAQALLVGFWVGLSIAAVKLLPLIYCISFLAALRGLSKRALGVAGFLIAIVPVYGFCLFKGLNIFYPLQFEGRERTASCFPWVVEVLSGYRFSDSFWNGVSAIALISVTIVCANILLQSPDERRPAIIFRSLIVVTLTLMFFAKKSWPNYAILALLPMCSLFDFEADEFLPLALFQVFNIVAVSIHSFWFTFFHEESSLESHARLFHFSAPIIELLVLHIPLLGCYIWLALRSLRLMRTDSVQT